VAVGPAVLQQMLPAVLLQGKRTNVQQMQNKAITFKLNFDTPFI
jgi:hypothetical protein